MCEAGECEAGECEAGECEAGVCEAGVCVAGECEAEECEVWDFKVGELGCDSVGEAKVKIFLLKLVGEWFSSAICEGVSEYMCGSR